LQKREVLQVKLVDIYAAPENALTLVRSGDARLAVKER
jgi:hypothetical protein